METREWMKGSLTIDIILYCGKIYGHWFYWMKSGYESAVIFFDNQWINTLLCYRYIDKKTL